MSSLASMLDAAAEQPFKTALACAWPMVVFIDRTYQGCEEFGGTPHEASPVPAEVGIQWRWAPAWHAGATGTNKDDVHVQERRKFSSFRRTGRGDDTFSTYSYTVLRKYIKYTLILQLIVDN